MGKDQQPAAIRRQVERLQQSAIFANSGRLLALLRFVVDETLERGGLSLKESVIGNAIYDRKPSYDPRIDSTVRVEVRRLRRKLTEYYDTEGQSDPIRINLPIGRYVPEFEFLDNKTPPSVAGVTRDGGSPMFGSGRGARLAIMPIRALSSDPEDEIFADGLTDELIYAIERSAGLRVTPRGVIFQYKNKPYSLPLLSNELGVDVVLQGTVRRQGELIRVTIELSDPRGFTIWSDRFNGAFRDRMDFQEKIALTTRSRVQLDSSLMRTMQISPGPSALEHLARIYRARQLLVQQTPAAIQEALGIFTQVSVDAPDYARGHSGMADCYCDLFRLGVIDHAAAFNTATAAVRRALAADPDSAEGQIAKATVAAFLQRDRAAAERIVQSAMQLGPNARAARLYGVILTLCGRHEDAGRMFRDAREIEPFSPQQDIAEAICNYQARRFDRLLRTEAETLGYRMPVEAIYYKALAHVFSGDLAGVQPLVVQLDRDASRYPDLVFASAELEARLHEPGHARRLLAQGLPSSTAYARATLAAALGEACQCLDALEAAIDHHELMTAWLATDARFDGLRGLPRFTAVLVRANAENKRTDQLTSRDLPHTEETMAAC